MALRIVIGDATRPEGDGPKVLAHVCNDIGAWGAGFVKAVSARWPEPERDYLKAHKDGKLALGSARFVDVGGGLTVASLIAMHGVRRGKGAPIRYEALCEGLSQVAAFARERKSSVHMPRIGCGLAGGRWSKVEPIVRETLRGLDVVVYDLA